MECCHCVTGEIITIDELNGSLSGSSELSFTLQAVGVVDGELSSERTLSGELQSVSVLTGTINVLQNGGGEYEIYDGPYRVIPKTDSEIVLDTDNKLMINDVTVEQVPYYETLNLSGGNTVYIGGD